MYRGLRGEDSEAEWLHSWKLELPKVSSLLSGGWCQLSAATSAEAQQSIYTWPLPKAPASSHHRNLKAVRRLTGGLETDVPGHKGKQHPSSALPWEVTQPHSVGYMQVTALPSFRGRERELGSQWKYSKRLSVVFHKGKQKICLRVYEFFLLD